SRSLLAEITRHRHLSFSVVSQRYVDKSEARWITPPAIPDVLTGGDPVGKWSGELDHDVRRIYLELVRLLVETGLTRKQAREAARSVLPNATETKFIVTGNLRAWRDVLSKRLSPTADAEIQQLAQEILVQLQKLAPNTFQDMIDHE